MTDAAQSGNSVVSNLADRPDFTRKAVVERIMKQVELERNPLHAFIGAVMGAASSVKTTDLLLVILDPPTRELLEKRLEEFSVEMVKAEMDGA